MNISIYCKRILSLIYSKIIFIINKIESFVALEISYFNFSRFFREFLYKCSMHHSKEICVKNRLCIPRIKEKTDLLNAFIIYFIKVDFRGIYWIEFDFFYVLYGSVGKVSLILLWLVVFFLALTWKIHLVADNKNKYIIYLIYFKRNWFTSRYGS